MHFLLGGIGALIILILRLIPSTREYGIIVGWILRIIPSFSFGYGVINISSKTAYASLIGRKTPFLVYDMDIAGGDVILMSIEGLVYFILVFVVEKC